MENMSQWVELVYDYGPYAVFAIFALWVAPSRTREFLACNKHDPFARRFCAGIATGSWVLVVVMVVMVGVIWQSWPPKVVYQGSLGIHGDHVDFIPGANLYLSTSPHGGRLEWRYTVIVDNQSSLENNSQYLLTYRWGDGEEDFRDYFIPLQVFENRSFALHANPDHPQQLLDENGEVFDVALHQRPATGPALPIAQDWFSAFAQAPLDQQQLLKYLASSNPNFRVHARERLRELSPGELKMLLEFPAITGQASFQIKHELRRRD